MPHHYPRARGEDGRRVWGLPMNSYPVRWARYILYRVFATSIHCRVSDQYSDTTQEYSDTRSGVQIQLSTLNLTPLGTPLSVGMGSPILYSYGDLGSPKFGVPILAHDTGFYSVLT